MGKRRNHDAETEEQRKERKRIKKEQKRRRKEGKENEQQVDIPTTTIVSKESQELSDVFYRKKIVLTISLLPSALSNVVAHAEDALRLYLLKYSDGIGGIMLAFENVKILSENQDYVAGSILDELPYIHYKVSTNVLVFNPSPGSKMRGTVTDESFHSHVSLIVHNYFNASIPADMLRDAGFEFDTVQMQWYYQRDPNATALKRNDIIDFTCHKLYEAGGIISIEGTDPVFVSLPSK